MFSEYTTEELQNIFMMQGFSGLSLFSVLLLMGLGLALIFGQMGVINMAHGEFMALGAYTVYYCSSLTAEYAPAFGPYYFVCSIGVAFLLCALAGAAVEFLMIRHLYHRPLDTLLATWGLSLIMQQSYRSFFGAREVTPNLPEWLMGSFMLKEGLDIPINGVFVLCLALAVTLGMILFLHRSRFGLRLRATVQNRKMSNAVGINTGRVDRLAFALGCGIAGIAGAAFTTIGSTGPDSGSRYIVDAFLVVVFGGAANMIGCVVSAFGIAQAQSVLEFFLDGTKGKVATLLVIVAALMFRPQGLFPGKVRGH